jgi:hypothetical protein
MRAIRWTSVLVGAATVLACSTSSPGTAGVTPDAKASNACAPLSVPSAKLDYEAVTPDGHHVVVLSDASGTARVFYGTADHVGEGRITGASDSCAHEVDFTVDGTHYSATFSPATICSTVPGHPRIRPGHRVTRGGARNRSRAILARRVLRRSA